MKLRVVSYHDRGDYVTAVLEDDLTNWVDVSCGKDTPLGHYLFAAKGSVTAINVELIAVPAVENG